MAKSVVAALALLACVAHTAQAQNRLVTKIPSFCHGLDCPKFKVVSTTDAYEVRAYEAAVWATVSVEAYAYALATTQGFRKLFKYIDGGNTEEVKIPMTSPVLVDMEPSCGPFCKQNFTVSFFVPFHLHDHPPAPLDPAVTISQTQPFTAYVAQKGGFLIDDYSVARMAQTLSETLDAEDVEYDDSHFFAAGYDPPFRLSGRHNEIWIIAKDDARAGAAAEQ